MYKSTKRIRLEEEIFSKSIKDIEQMFTSPYRDPDIYKDNVKRHKSSSKHSSSDLSNTLDRSDLPAGNMFEPTNLNYNCINMALFSSRASSEIKDQVERDECYKEQNITYESSVMKPPVFSSLAHIPGYSYNLQVKSVPLDLNEEEDMEDYRFGSDLKSYLPRLNLESDLKIIDQMFTGTLLTKAG